VKKQRQQIWHRKVALSQPAPEPAVAYLAELSLDGAVALEKPLEALEVERRLAGSHRDRPRQQQERKLGETGPHSP